MKKSLLWFFAVIIAIVLGYYLFSTKSYPVASVGTSFISAQKLETSYQAGLSYYQKEASLALSEEEVAKSEFQQELRRATLDKLIEHKLIQQLLYGLLGSEEAEARVEARIGEVLETRTAQTDEAVQRVFGLDWQDFETLIVRPEAERELLAQHLEGEGIEFISWFDEQLRSAEIEVLISGFEWRVNEVEIVQ
ncbi:MAG: SurA N-terminal domain-containing protein [Candidatus Harrisonbacteria bacterium]|nr:SurA N-terminal domain-containing protein [Candidatus Harrisonbacteria bacterium]